MPKHIKTPDPDTEYVQGNVRLIRLGSTIYLYLEGHVHPVMTRKCGDEPNAITIFYRLKFGFKSLWKPSLRDRLRMLWWRLTK